MGPWANHRKLFGSTISTTDSPEQYEQLRSQGLFCHAQSMANVIRVLKLLKIDSSKVALIDAHPYAE
jgi:hypothetical protein